MENQRKDADVKKAFILGKLLSLTEQRIDYDQATSEEKNFAKNLGKIASEIDPSDIRSRVANETVGDLFTFFLPEQFWKFYFLGYISKYVSKDTFILLEKCVTEAEFYKHWQYAVSRCIILLCNSENESESQAQLALENAQLELVRSSFKKECYDSINMVKSWFEKFKKLPSAAYENFLNCKTELGALCALAEGLSNVGESIDLFD